MSMKIILREMQLSCLIGINAAEKHLRQRLLLDADITLAAPPADDATPSYDYDAAAAALRALAAKQHYGLMETFAEQAAAVLLAQGGASAVRVYVRKPQVFADLAAAGVEIEKHLDS